MRRAALLTALAICALLAGTATASAAVRYAAPGGTGPPLSCPQSNPCGIVDAVNAASLGDEIVLAGGDYGSPGTPIATALVSPDNVNIHPAAGATRPRLFSNANYALTIAGSGSSLRDLEVIHSGTLGALNASGTADRVIARSSAFVGCTIALSGTIIRNSVCQSSSASGFGVLMSMSFGFPSLATGTLRNVTAIAGAANGVAIFVSAGNFAQLTLNATNTIAQGASNDVYAEVIGGGGASARVNLDHSNYDTISSFGSATVSPAGSPTNQTAAPLFANFAAADFHQAAGSPTIDAGVSDAANGGLDFDGATRTEGPRTDIGADEALPPTSQTAACRGRTVTVVGTAGDDRLVGTSGDDVIAALAGDDEVRAKGGQDVICGAAGGDLLRGGRGADVVVGKAGKDALYGEAGADILYGGRGNDSLWGGSAFDSLFGAAGRDRLLGNGGRDVTNGGAGGPDVCNGGPGPDLRRARGCERAKRIP